MRREIIITNSVYADASGRVGCTRLLATGHLLDGRQYSTAPVTGSSMSVLGPATRAMAAVSGGYTTQSTRSAERPKARVFVVDDEDFIRDLYKEVFESKGFTVFSAASGEEAIKILSTMPAKPDAVIMDHRMPGKDGIETTKELLKLVPDLTIIFSSADESVREEALRAGAVSFWAKPFPVGLLANAMLDLIEARRRRH